MNFLEAFKHMKDAGFADSDVVRLLSCCGDTQTALDFASYCIAMKRAWMMLEALDPQSCVVTFKDGSWGFETKPDVITLGGWDEQLS
jgi:hypothetical protein